jgi:hypothetical protein
LPKEPKTQDDGSIPRYSSNAAHARFPCGAAAKIFANKSVAKAVAILPHGETSVCAIAARRPIK